MSLSNRAARRQRCLRARSRDTLPSPTDGPAVVVVEPHGGRVRAAPRRPCERRARCHTERIYFAPVMPSPIVSSRLPSTAIAELSPVPRSTRQRGSCWCASDSPFKSMQDLIAAANAAPGKLISAGISGIPAPPFGLVPLESPALRRFPCLQGSGDEAAPAAATSTSRSLATTLGDAAGGRGENSVSSLPPRTAFSVLPGRSPLWNYSRTTSSPGNCSGVRRARETHRPLIARLHAERSKAQALADPTMRNGGAAGGKRAAAGEPPERSPAFACAANTNWGENRESGCKIRLRRRSINPLV